MSLEKDARGTGEWDNALRTNLHDVEDWITNGYVTGTVNIQIYGNNIETVKNDFDKFKESLERKLGKEIQHAIAFASRRSIRYLYNFPEIEITVAAYANGKLVPEEELRDVINHIKSNRKIIPKHFLWDAISNIDLIRDALPFDDLISADGVFGEITVAVWHARHFHLAEEENEGLRERYGSN